MRSEVHSRFLRSIHILNNHVPVQGLAMHSEPENGSSYAHSPLKSPTPVSTNYRESSEQVLNSGVVELLILE